MEKEIQTIINNSINKLMSDLEAAQDLSAYLAANNKKLRDALHRISLGSQNSMTTKEDLGKEARATLKEGE